MAPAGAQVAGRTPSPAIAECSRLNGGLVPQVDARPLFHAPSGDFSILLPGRDWCETVAPGQPYSFVWLRLLAQRRLSSPNARAEEAAMVEVRAMPLPSPIGQPIPTPEALRDSILAVRRGERPAPGTEGLMNLLNSSTRVPGFSMSIAEGGARCLRLHGEHDVPAVPAPRTIPNRHIQTETSYCLAQHGGAAAILIVISALPAGDQVAAGAVASIHERVRASIHFEPLADEVSPACRPVQALFQRVFPDCARKMGVQAEPGAPRATEVAMGCLGGAMANSHVDARLQRRCFAEVLRDAGFRDALPFDILQRLRPAPTR